MDKIQKEITLEILTENMDLSKLPDDALNFLVQYLLTPSASQKVSILLGEIDRLYNRLDFNEYYEHVGFHTSK